MLTLTVTRYRQMPPVQPSTTRFDRAGGTIGRASDNEWVLPDPEQHLSKHHCRIRYDDGSYTITDTSSNGVFVNGDTQPLGPNNSRVLRDRDRLDIGDFEIDVRITGESGAEAMEPSRPVSDDPFGLGRWEEPPRPSGPPETCRAAYPTPFGSETSGDNFWNRIGRTDDDWATPSDHLPSEQEVVRVAPVERPLIPEDWDKSPLIEPPPFEPIAAPPDLPGAEFTRAEPPMTKAVGGMSAASAGPLSPGDEGLLAAFLDGAGLGRIDLSDQNPAEVMHRAGEIMRAAVEGLRDVLISRAMLKNEFRIAQTVIRVSGNNPVKFSPGVDDTLAALLSSPKPGYMPAVPAMRQGFSDLKAHEVATLAALQAAVTKLFRNFDPEHLKQRLERHSILDDILPRLRKAKYWELYEEHYRQISGEMAEDLQGVFWREFARAYEEQMRKLRDEPTAGKQS
jgi:type VI secretion system FHA domain protein